MRVLILLLVILLFSSCKKSANNIAAGLLRIEPDDDYGNIMHTEYSYDNEGRIVRLKEHENNAEGLLSVVNITSHNRP